MKTKDENLDISCIGIGASAGGLGIITKILDTIKNPPDVPIFIMQHLSRNHKSHMKELLSRHTFLQIEEANDGTIPRNNVIYLNPPGQVILLENGHVKLKEINHDDLNSALSINHFFHSLSEFYKEKLMVIVLTGTGTDGTKGTLKVKSNGGCIIIQDPETAEFSGMPESVLRSGAYDLILKPEDIAKKIEKPQEIEKESLMFNPELFNNTLNILKDHSGIDFSLYKTSTLMRRIEKRIRENSFNSFQKYIKYLIENDDEKTMLVDNFLIGVTEFYRNPEVFNYFHKTIIPQLARLREQLRVWVVGCSTGEEVYSVAVLLENHFVENGLEADYKIFATDINENYLIKARHGRYPLKNLPFNQIENIKEYFKIDKDQAQIIKRIREKIVFTKHNILSDPPFINANLVICRNLLIYFNDKAQNRILSSLSFALKKGGYLMLGKNEHLGDFIPYYDTVNMSLRIYQLKVKYKKTTRTFNDSEFNNITTFFERTTRQLANQQQNAHQKVEDEFDLVLKELFIPTSVFVDDKFEIKYINGDTGLFKLSNGVLEPKLENVMEKNLAIMIKNGMRKVSRENKIKLSNVNIESENKQIFTFDVHIDYCKKLSNKNNIYLVTFHPTGNDQRASSEYEYSKLDVAKNEEIDFLANELIKSKKETKKLITELETSNEELQTSNEELLASNEELQSTNEELQSVNEELYTVNAELQQKNLELEELYNDLDNLLANISVGTLFLDKDLRIRKFTPLIRKHFNLIDEDIGRPLNIFKSHFDEFVTKDLLKKAGNVRNSGIPVDMHVHCLNDNEDYLVRISPFKTENGIKGVLLVFDNITQLKKIESELKKALNKAKKADQLKSAFLANMSHEIRTPMNAIIGLSQIIKNNELSQEERVTYFDIIISQGNQLLSIINDIIDISKIESGNFELSNKHVHVVEIINEIFESFKIQAKENVQLLFTNNIKPEDGTMILDPVRFKQVLNNLVSNAMKFTENGYIEIICETDKMNNLEVTVKDSGIGISNELTERIFDRFFRVMEDNYVKKVQGTGLGLSITKAMIEKMGGRIWVNSKVGHGSSFHFTIPAKIYKNNSPKKIKEQHNNVVPEYEKLNVLIVEDQDSNYHVIHKLLSKLGLKSIRVTNGNDALELLESNGLLNIDLIFMDIRLPGMDGLTVIKKIRDMGLKIPIIVQTAYAMKSDRDLCMKSGANEYISKPLNEFELVEKISKVLAINRVN